MPLRPSLQPWLGLHALVRQHRVPAALQSTLGVYSVFSLRLITSYSHVPIIPASQGRSTDHWSLPLPSLPQCPEGETKNNGVSPHSLSLRRNAPWLFMLREQSPFWCSKREGQSPK